MVLKCWRSLTAKGGARLLGGHGIIQIPCSAAWPSLLLSGRSSHRDFRFEKRPDMSPLAREQTAIHQNTSIAPISDHSISHRRHELPTTLLQG